MSRQGASQSKTRRIDDSDFLQVWERLQRNVISRILKARRKPEQLRAWVVGCSTGKLAYWLAILLLEATAKSDHPCDVQVFATDLEDAALDAARKGTLAPEIESNIDSYRLHQFFQKETDGYRVRPEVRDCVLFLRHDLIKDPPFMGLHLILCRQPLSHLDDELQERACRILHSALLPDGLLMLDGRIAGHSIDPFFESIDPQTLRAVDSDSSLLLLSPGAFRVFTPGQYSRQLFRKDKEKGKRLEPRQILHTTPPPDPMEDLEAFVLEDPSEHTPLERYLASEVNRTRELLQTTVEEFRSSQTELQATIESLAATTADLESTKAELRSATYESRVLKESLRSRVRALLQANKCFEKIIYLTGLAAIFLDSNHNLLSYTPTIEDLFSLCSANIGLPIGEIPHRLDSNQFLDDVYYVTETGMSTQSEVRSADGRWFLARTSRFQTDRDQVTGVVISFTDVTHLKEASILLEEATDRLEQTMEAKTTELQRKKEELKKEEKKRKELQRRVSEISNERQRILGEQLHDSLAQLLSGTRMLAKSLHLRLEKNKKVDAADLEELLSYLESAEKEAQDLARGLVPVRFDSSGGLVASLEKLVQRTCNLWTEVDCQLEAEPSTDVQEELAAVKLYYIAQEALNNALKHGQASWIRIRLRKDSKDRIILEIEDNGRGIRKSDIRKARGVGIQIMRHRAELIDAQLKINRKKDGGTLVRCIYESRR